MKPVYFAFAFTTMTLQKNIQKEVIKLWFEKGIHE